MPEPWGKNNTRRTLTNTIKQQDIINNYVDTTTLYGSQIMIAPATTYTFTSASNSNIGVAAFLPGRTFFRNMNKTTGNTTDTFASTASFIAAVEATVGQTWNTYEYYHVWVLMKNNDVSSRNYIMNFGDTSTYSRTGTSSISTNSITSGSTFAQRVTIMRMSATEVMFYVYITN